MRKQGKHARQAEPHSMRATPLAAVATIAAGGAAGLVSAPPGLLAAPPVPHSQLAPARFTGLRSFLPSLASVKAADPRYTIRPGDTLYGVAQRLCSSGSRWPSLWRANPYIHDPYLIYPGKPLKVACDLLSGMSGRVVAAHWAAVHTPVVPDPPPAAPQGDPSPSGQQPPPPSVVTVSSGTYQQYALSLFGQYGWDPSQMNCLDPLWMRESGWNVYAYNQSGATGIPQALPGNKMASAGSDWRTNGDTQIRWGEGYIKGTYGTPCGAWDHELADNWY